MKTQEEELSKFSKNMTLFIFDFQINHFHQFMFLNTL